MARQGACGWLRGVNHMRARLLIVFVAALGALGLLSSAASAQSLPRHWDPSTVAVNHDPANTFLLRPGQILAGPGDAVDVARVLTGWRRDDDAPYGITVFTHAVPPGADPARDVLAAIDRVRRVTGQRPQGPALVAPNYIFVGEAAGNAISFYGEPRVQGGPGSSVRVAAPPAAMPLRTTMPTDGAGVRIAVLDTGLFDNPWLIGVTKAPGATDVWDADHDGYGDEEAGHGTFISGLIRQVAPAAGIYVSKVLNSHGIGDDLGVATAIAALPGDVSIINLSLGGYTDHDGPPLALTLALHDQHRAVVAAAGNAASDRPFWPAAFPQVLGVGAIEQHSGKWDRASYSNHGKWVKAVARGTNLQSTFTHAKTLVAQSDVLDPAHDPSITFDDWASWDGTSFATPVAAAMIARTMSRGALNLPTEAKMKLLATSPASGIADFPNAVRLDELEGRPDPTESGTGS